MKRYYPAMKVHPEQLADYLQRQSVLPAVFFLSGDEPLQLMEAADSIRTFAHSQGFSEREILHVDGQFDWNQLSSASSELSLFSERKVIDLRIYTKTPGKSGSQVLRHYAKQPPGDKILLIQTPRLDRGTRNSAWVKALDASGVMIQVWDLSAPQTMAWIVKRMRVHGMHPTPDAVKLLTERVEGNLLAALQEIRKLALLYSDSDAPDDKDQPDKNSKRDLKPVEISDQMVLDSVSDSSRFSIFDFADAVMSGDAHRIQHIHQILKQEGTAVQLVLWALTDLSRQLYEASFKVHNGISQSQVISALPRPRQKLFQTALQRMRQTEWPEVLRLNSRIDRLSKGQGDTANKGMARVWEELLEFALILGGTRTSPGNLL